jgi:hypothetical protein
MAKEAGLFLIVALGAVLFAALAAPLLAQRPSEPGGRFGWVDVFVDSADAPLAAYQIEVRDPTGRFEIAGIEGGAHAAFVEPPYYDPAALAGGRVILAAFATAHDLPRGETRVARVHARIAGAAPVDCHAELEVAATREGQAIPVTVRLEEGERDGR